MCFLSIFYHGSFYSGTNYPPIIFPRVSDPIRGSAPQARPLDQSDGGCWYHSTVKPLSIRLLLLQSIGYESDWLQPTKRALKPIQDQPCRWWTESHSSWKKLQCLKKKNQNETRNALTEPACFGFPSSWWKSCRCSRHRNRAWQHGHLLDSKISLKINASQAFHSSYVKMSTDW